MRTAALLALERRDLATAAGLNEHILGMFGGGRPVFDYLAQLDRARIWAAGGNLDEALSSLPAARTALKSDRSVLFTQADELEVRFRLALGDHRGALALAERLPDDRRIVLSAIIALGAGDPQSAAEALSSAPARGPTIRSDLELRLLRASTAVMQTHTRHPNWSERLSPSPSATATSKPCWRRPPGWSTTWSQARPATQHRQPQSPGRCRSASPQAR